MSATAPYVVSRETSPRKLRLLLARNPAAISLYRNLVHGQPLATKVFVDGGGQIDDDDPFIDFIVDTLTGLELVAKKQDEILEPLYNDIVITKESFTPEEKKIFSYNVLKQSLAAIAADTDKPVDAAYYVGSLTEEEFSAKSEEFYAHQDKYRNKPDGKISYITAWVCRQI